MKVKPHRRAVTRVDVQVSVFAAVIATISCFLIFSFHYYFTYHNMIYSLVERVDSIHAYVQTLLSSELFDSINQPEDMDSETYQQIHKEFYRIKEITGVEYLYTAKCTQDGQYIYVIDGLDPEASDFRRLGDLIEPEIIPELTRALAGERILPSQIKKTDWGKIFISYLPISDGDRVVGVVGIEFRAEAQYDTYQFLRRLTPLVTLMICAVSACFAFALFRRISNPSYQDLSSTDHLTQTKNRNSFEVHIGNLDPHGRQEMPGVIAVDLNNLKLVNDTLGHEFGDLYLQCAAQALQRLCARGEVVFRVGGDEFVVLVRAKPLAQLQQQMEQMRQYFLTNSPDWGIALSLSMGCALFDPQQDQSFDNVYRRADLQMYQEKEAYHQNFHQREG